MVQNCKTDLINIDNNNNNNDLIKLFDKVKNIYSNIFKNHNYSINDNFDYNVWFIKNNFNLKSINSFKCLLDSIPSETDDIIIHIIKIMLSQSCINNDNYFLISSFIEELTKQTFNLILNLKKANKLIENYKSYDLVTKLEYILNNSDKTIKEDTIRSSLNGYINKCEALFSSNEFLVSICCSFIKEDGSHTNLEYKSRNILKSIYLNNQTNYDYFKYEEHCFPKIEFYSYDNTNANKSLLEKDSGTNLYQIYLKLENLDSNVNKYLYSNKKTFFDIILPNIALLINSHKKNKIIVCEFEFDYEHLDKPIVFTIEFKVDIDSLTLYNICSKILSLQKHLISFNVQNNYKLDTILNYFPESEAEIKLAISNSNKNYFKSNNKMCILF